MKKLLIPTDFSSCADTSIDFAVQTNKLFTAKLSLLHVINFMGNVYGDYTGMSVELYESMIQQSEKEMASLKNQLAKRGVGSVNTEISNSAVTDSILQAIIEQGIDMVIMGTHGASGLKEKFWGTQTAELIGKANVPVIVVPSDYEWKKPEKLLFATNNFVEDKETLMALFEIADFYKVEVQVMVFTGEDEDTELEVITHKRSAPGYQAVLERKYPGRAIQVTQLFGRNFEDSITNFVYSNHIDMLAMVSHKRTFLGGLFHPSMTKRISFHTKVPFLVIPDLSGRVIEV
ncbi:nucleotide-binding universal stress UspA family protein [Pedobacter sp. UYP24]